MDKMKNIEKSQVLTLREQVACQSGQVVSRRLGANNNCSKNTAD